MAISKYLDIVKRSWRNIVAKKNAFAESSLYKKILHYRPKRDQRIFGIRIFRVAGITIVVYILIVGSAAIFIYKGNTNVLTRFAEKIATYPAAITGRHVIYLSRYREEVKARQTYASVHDLQTSNTDIATFVINQLIDRQLYKDVLDRSDLKINDSEVEAKLKEIRDQVQGDDKLQAFLKQNYGDTITLSTFKRWLTEAGYESLLQSQVLESAKIRHILISLPANATDAQKETARQKALTIKATITAPEQFGAAARQYSEDIVSRDRDGEFGTTNRGDTEPVISTDFEKAIFELPVNTVSDPVLSKYGWHLVLVEERKGNVQLSKKAFTEQLRQDAGAKILIPLK